MNGKILIILVAAAAMLSNGCGKKNDTAEGAQPQAGPTQSTPATAPPNGPAGPAESPGTSTNSTTAPAHSAQSVAALKVKNAFNTSKQKAAFTNVTVESTGDIVHLRGSVSNAAQKSEAEKIAKQAVGDKGNVQNDLTVKGG